MESDTETHNEVPKRRSSILKPQKQRQPLSAIDGIDCVGDSTINKTRRVSFANSNSVKPFVQDAERNTLWDETYEEQINHTDSKQDMEYTCEHPTLYGILNSTKVTSKTINFTETSGDLEMTAVATTEIRTADPDLFEKTMLIGNEDENTLTEDQIEDMELTQAAMKTIIEPINKENVPIIDENTECRLLRSNRKIQSSCIKFVDDKENINLRVNPENINQGYTEIVNIETKSIAQITTETANLSIADNFHFDSVSITQNASKNQQSNLYKQTKTPKVPLRNQSSSLKSYNMSQPASDDVDQAKHVQPVVLVDNATMLKPADKNKFEPNLGQNKSSEHSMRTNRSELVLDNQNKSELNQAGGNVQLKHVQNKVNIFNIAPDIENQYEHVSRAKIKPKIVINDDVHLDSVNNDPINDESVNSQFKHVANAKSTPKHVPDSVNIDPIINKDILSQNKHVPKPKIKPKLAIRNEVHSDAINDENQYKHVEKAKTRSKLAMRNEVHADLISIDPARDEHVKNQHEHVSRTKIKPQTVINDDVHLDSVNNDSINDENVDSQFKHVKNAKSTPKHVPDSVNIDPIINEDILSQNTHVSKTKTKPKLAIRNEIHSDAVNTVPVNDENQYKHVEKVKTRSKLAMRNEVNADLVSIDPARDEHVENQYEHVSTVKTRSKRGEDENKLVPQAKTKSKLVMRANIQIEDTAGKSDHVDENQDMQKTTPKLAMRETKFLFNDIENVQIYEDSVKELSHRLQASKLISSPNSTDNISPLRGFVRNADSGESNNNDSVGENCFPTQSLVPYSTSSGSEDMSSISDGSKVLFTIKTQNKLKTPMSSFCLGSTLSMDGKQPPDDDDGGMVFEGEHSIETSSLIATDGDSHLLDAISPTMHVSVTDDEPVAKLTDADEEEELSSTPKPSKLSMPPNEESSFTAHVRSIINVDYLEKNLKTFNFPKDIEEMKRRRQILAEYKEVRAKWKTMRETFEFPQLINWRERMLECMNRSESMSVDCDSSNIGNKIMMDVQRRKSFHETFIEESDKSQYWNFRKAENNNSDYYVNVHFNMVTLKVNVVDSEDGRVSDFEIIINENVEFLTEQLKLLHEFTMISTFLPKLEEGHLKSAIGDTYDLLSLLDYIRLSTESISKFIADYKELRDRRKDMHLKILPNYSITSDILDNTNVVLWWRMTIKMNSLESIESIDVQCQLTRNHMYNFKHLSKSPIQGQKCLFDCLEKFYSYYLNVKKKC